MLFCLALFRQKVEYIEGILYKGQGKFDVHSFIMFHKTPCI